MTLALIMAGGRSDRMRSSFGPSHKALVPVVGVPMIERNILSLLARGIRQIVVAISPKEREIQAYVVNRGAELVESAGGTIECLFEEQPLGTIGAITKPQISADQVLVTNVDNLTTLDWRALIEHHENMCAPMTIAAHWASFRIPLGELDVIGGNVIAYREKPLKQILISSGSYVVSRVACNLLPKEQKSNVPDLVRLLLDSGRSVVAFEHKALWIDINDATSLAEAERLISANFRDFEWEPRQ
jgi:NDP-sugar pyrophosphorylase family protein